MQEAAKSIPQCLPLSAEMMAKTHKHTKRKQLASGCPLPEVALMVTV